MQHLFPGHVLLHIHDNTTARYGNSPSDEGPAIPAASTSSALPEGKV